ncbi:MAG TPA: HEAT repeat domain-containing protein [Planctomycetota bacterium]|nr:HEAT repeat domain-containing protein [Planctomycetota bacterium]
MKRTMLAIAAVLSMACAPALSGEEPKAQPKLTPELYRQLAEKSLAMQDRATATKEKAAELQAEVEKHRAELLGALSGGEALERSLAAGLLGMVKSDQDKVAEALAKALSDDDLDVRRGAAVSLFRLKKPAGTDALIKALEDSDEQVRAAAAAALGVLKAAKARDGLLKLVEDDSWMVRLQTVRALEAVTDKDGVKAVAEKLKALLDDENAYVRMAATAAITKLTGVKPEGAPDAADKEVLHNLAKEMGGVKNDLDREHHGSEVQVAQGKITEKLDKLIQAIQEQQQQQQQSQGKPKEGEPKPGDPKQGPGNKGKGKAQQNDKPTEAATSEAMSSGSVKEGARQAADVSVVGGKWGNLPPRKREELELAESQGLPERYRKLLEMYFMSVAEEEK